MSPDPLENKTLWTVSSFFQLGVYAVELYISVTSQTKNQNKDLCLISGGKRAEQ